MRRTQRRHTRQWWARGGRYVSHFMHTVQPLSCNKLTITFVRQAILCSGLEKKDILTVLKKRHIESVPKKQMQWYANFKKGKQCMGEKMLLWRLREPNEEASPRKTWKEVVDKDTICIQNQSDAMDHRKMSGGNRSKGMAVMSRVEYKSYIYGASSPRLTWI